MNQPLKRDNTIRHSIAGSVATAVLAAAAVLFAARAVPARAPDRLCKQIREAVGAGLTLEQITRAYDTDAAHVMKCVQSKGRKRKVKPQAKSPSRPHGVQRKTGSGDTGT